MALLAKGVWALVADGERALFLENEGTPDKPRLALRRKLESAGADMELADKPGRMQDTGRQQLSAMELTDHDRIARDRFAQSVAETLNGMVAKKGIERLVIVAPPQTLSGLRDGVSDATRAVILAEIDKDLIHHPLDKVGKLIAQDIEKV
ncbi:host attachment protein [Rhodobacteraceae bacterium 2376]|uniref:Host attachment protein n=1 Tax=Rhabdonatronobacter sediminivivens TaxID=2743469 RepID=A0A7Z0HZB8_9RHOB|nr:host attachment family protein [Rhabdonatronobacter sediminivivens]NYS24970.1 host attachment protein [Rhabdonatronobacter sediminivivens]